MVVSDYRCRHGERMAGSEGLSPGSTSTPRDSARTPTRYRRKALHSDEGTWRGPVRTCMSGLGRCVVCWPRTPRSGSRVSAASPLRPCPRSLALLLRLPTSPRDRRGFGRRWRLRLAHARRRIAPPVAAPMTRFPCSAPRPLSSLSVRSRRPCTTIPACGRTRDDCAVLAGGCSLLAMPVSRTCTSARLVERRGGRLPRHCHRPQRPRRGCRYTHGHPRSLILPNRDTAACT